MGGIDISKEEAECEHDWQRHDQPFAILRICGWKCTLCGKPAMFDPHLLGPDARPEEANIE